MIVMKFGGSSLSTPASINSVTEIIKARLDRGPVLVVSAHGGATDILFNLARGAVTGRYDIAEFKSLHENIIAGLGLDSRIIDGEIDELEELLKGISYVKELTPRSLDYVVSFGEKISSRIIAAHLSGSGVPAVACNAYDLGLVTDSHFGGATPLPESEAAIAANLRNIKDKTPVITGYIAKNNDGDITTLGRHGSDYSASIVGAAVDAEEVQLWTDVDGVMTADPRVVPGARPLGELSFQEASELAYYGAEVIHPSTMIPAVRKKIPIRVLNTYRPGSPGTIVLSECEEKPGTVKAIAHKKGLTLVNVVSTRMLLQHGFVAKLFEIFNQYRIVIDMIATSEVSVSLTTDTRSNISAAVRELSHFADVSVTEKMAIICVVGEGIPKSLDTPARVFTSLAEKGINVRMISQGATRINLAFLVDDRDAEAAVKILHHNFFEQHETGKTCQHSYLTETH
ncbi:MAG: aspartate kinase [Planctomycetota bacterium]